MAIPPRLAELEEDNVVPFPTDRVKNRNVIRTLDADVIDLNKEPPNKPAPQSTGTYQVEKYQERVLRAIPGITLEHLMEVKDGKHSLDSYLLKRIAGMDHDKAMEFMKAEKR